MSRLALDRGAATLVATVFCGALLAGCGGSGGNGAAGSDAGGADARTVSGTANAIVTVKAVPKRGWRDPGGQTSAYDGQVPGESPSFTQLDYSNLDEIVVWVSPATDVAFKPAPLSIDIASPPLALVVAGQGAIWSIRNSGRAAETLYLRSEEGQVVNLGRLDPGGLIEYAPTLAGPLELMRDSRPQQPIARAFVANSPAVRVISSSEPAEFRSLPPGPAIVGCWHPRLPGTTRSVNLEPGRTARVGLTLTVNDLPKIP